jgi:hypothetical protein
MIIFYGSFRENTQYAGFPSLASHYYWININALIEPA